MLFKLDCIHYLLGVHNGHTIGQHLLHYSLHGLLGFLGLLFLELLLDVLLRLLLRLLHQPAY